MSNDFLSRPINAGARFAERRCCPRYPFVASAEILEPVTRIKLAGQTVEIGMKGCYVDVLNPLPATSVIQLSIHRDIGTFQTWGRIVYIHEEKGVGIAFFQTRPDQEKLLADWIAELGR